MSNPGGHHLDSTRSQWLDELVTALEEALTEPDAPTGNLEWLILRARDTLLMSGAIAVHSMLALAQSIAVDLRAYPSEIPKALLRAATSIPGTALPFALLRAEAFTLGLPGAPRWQSLILTGPLPVSTSSRLTLAADDIASPEAFAERFIQLLSRGYAWINLHVAGLRQDTLLISVELPMFTRAGVTNPSINICGPIALVREQPGWQLDNFIDFDDALGPWTSS
ncbi:MAG: hypothetical protein HOW73_34610 [Polyangiaceae bacterium]|nr:hypothetical protein [Polyangiaceae bacterium]